MRRAIDAARRPFRRLAAAVRQLLGAPDYEAYLEHCRRAGHAVHLTRVEYVREFLDRKGATVRCC